MHKTFIWKPTGWYIGSCDIVWDSPCSGTLVKEQAFLYPSIFSLFLSFLALLSSFQACRVNCRTADFVMIEISWETSRKKKCCKNKATEGWGIQRDGSKKCGQMNVLPDTALASLREPCSHTTAVMNIPPCLAIPIPFFPLFSLLSLYPSSGCKLSLSTRNSLLSKLLFC